MKVSSRKVFFAFISLFMIFLLYIPIHSIKLNNVQGAESSTIVVWVNDGGEKITQDELRASIDPISVINSVWDGSEVSLFGARNEVVSFNLVIEAPSSDIVDIDVSLTSLEGPDGSEISTRPASGDDLFNYVGRNIELFYVRYLEIEGLTTDLAFAGYDYDQRHIPERFQLPYDDDYEGIGVWEDRPDHNKMYPDIAVPLELESPFTIKTGTSQSIWADIYIPKNTPPGDYEGIISIIIDGTLSHEVTITLDVRDFSLPDFPSAKTMLVFSPENINSRYFNNEYPDPGTDLYTQSIALQNQHFQLVHRHKISLIDGEDFDVTSETLDEGAYEAWISRLNGNLFTPEYGYEGIGEGVGNNVYSIGTYGSWHWQDGSEADMWENTDTWANWFTSQGFTTPTDYFLYLIDESDDFAQIEQWAKWMDSNPGPGKNLKSMATMPLPDAVDHTPSLDIPTSEGTFGITQLWLDSIKTHEAKSETEFYMYNGQRPAAGSFATEDDGIALRELAWGQYKMGVDRWFYWESTYYDNYQGDMGQTNLFQTAQTYGSYDRDDERLGKTGWNYFNGDGVLIYPGTDRQFAEESYGLEGPFASLRLKHWRRGIQDVDYLTLAAKIDPVRTAEIVEDMVPIILWEIGCELYQGECDGWINTDISWSTDPDVWEAARAELADIIEKGGTSEPEPQPEPEEQPLGTLRIRVYDEARSPLSDVTVYSSSQPEGQSSLDGTTSSEGEVTFREVLAGEYVIKAMKQDYESSTSTGGVALGDTLELVFYLEETETEPEPTPEVTESSGGIPSFPMISIIMGMAIVAIFLSKSNSPVGKDGGFGKIFNACAIE